MEKIGIIYNLVRYGKSRIYKGNAPSLVLFLIIIKRYSDLFTEIKK